jgi:Cu(I)/Ag(I) efflux system membrane fusion protein
MIQRDQRKWFALAATALAAMAVGFAWAASGHVSLRDHEHTAASAANNTGALIAAAPTGRGSGAVYACPMHPQIIQDHAGKCPICAMDLVKKRAAVAAHPMATATRPLTTAADTVATSAVSVDKATAATVAMPADVTTQDVQGVTLSPRQRVLANVEVALVGRRHLGQDLETTGRITFDETRLQRLSAWVGGRIDHLYGGATGSTISRGTVMATLYSPELVASQQEYLTARASNREMRHAPYPELVRGARALLDAARQRLSLFGISRAQIARLEATGKPLLDFPVLAPGGGIVVTRKVQVGQYVATGDVLYEVADLGRVWLEANPFEADLARVRPGQRVEVRTNAYPDKVFIGRVDAFLPALDATTRTGRLRVGLDNPRGLLRPDMYATARFATDGGAPDLLAVPSSAVIDTGRHHVVYVEVEQNRFVPREIQVGTPTGDFYPVLKGLKAGEKVAVSGGFLLDASAQLQGESEPGIDPAPSAPQGTTKGTAGIKGMKGMPGMEGMPGMAGTPKP